MTAGWVYVLESSARPGCVKIGATKNEDMRQAIEQVYRLTCASPVGEPVTSKILKVRAENCFWVEAAVHAALDPWAKIRHGREVFEIPADVAFRVASLASDILRPSLSREQYEWEVLSRSSAITGRDPITVPEVVARVSRAPRLGGRSKLYRWMVIHHDAFSAEVGVHKVDWRALADAFTALGLTDRNGSKVTGETARKTWYRVRQELPGLEEAAIVDGSSLRVEQKKRPRSKPRGGKVAAKPAAKNSPLPVAEQDDLDRVRAALSRGEEWMPRHTQSAHGRK